MASDTRDGFEVELSSYGQGGNVIRLVVKLLKKCPIVPKKITNAVAGELALEVCRFYGDKTSKAVKDFF